MHELSIAQNILDIVRESVSPHDLPGVRVVKLRVGHLAGVVPDSLDFSFTVLTTDTPLRHARLSIDHIPFAVMCNSCGKSFTNEIGFVLCPTCGGVDTKILSGLELQVVEIELEDSKAEAP
jgi:hydrogenase nickel incorporation protein HypA/HybF